MYLSVSILLFLFLLPIFGQEDDFDMDQVYAEEELQFGVRAFHEGSYNKALLSIEKSLSIKPDFTLAEDWLARTYHQNGYVSTALDIWSRLEEEGSLNTAGKVMYSMLNYRRKASEIQEENPKFVEFFKLEGTAEGVSLFKRPTAVVPSPDGSFYVVAFARNEVIQFSANGTIQRVLRGGIEGLHHPFDLVLHPDEGLFVTEFSADRIVQMSADGRVIRRIGESGTGPGQLLGPQCITDDGKGYLYVSDQGNRRIAKFDHEGNFILNFGEESRFFEGIGEPTGIIAYRDLIFVCDKGNRQLLVFDESGNHLRTIRSRFLKAPEALNVYNEGTLLISDETQVLLFDIDSESFSPLIIPDGSMARLIDAGRDANDNLLIADFNQSTISMQADFSRMYSGLYVQVNQVNSDEFPIIYTDVTVQRRDGAPFLGLQEENFYITEGRFPVDDGKLEYSVHQSDYTQISLLIENSERMRDNSEMIGQITGQLTEQLLPDGSVHVIQAGRDPVLRTEDSSDGDQIKAGVLSGALFEDWRFDQGLRLAASPLLDSGNRRAVVFFNSGYLNDEAFDSYELIHLVDFLKNNNIAFYSVSFDSEGRTAEEIEYLCEQTKGLAVYAYNPEGISPVTQALRRLPTGRYILSCRSRLEPDFGRAYLPLEIQVSIFGRSGRGEIGYYAPPE